MEEEERDAKHDAKHNSNHVTLDAISNDSMSRPTLDSTPIGLKTHCTISPSQGKIANLMSHSTILPSRHSTVSPSQGEIASVTSERRIS